MLCERKRLPQPLLYLSAFFERHDQEYKDRLLEVSRGAQWREWIGFFARGVAEQSRDAARRAGRLLELGQQYRQRVAGMGHSVNAVQLVDEVLASPFITVKRAAETLKVSFPTAQNAINKLIDAAILQEFTGQKRNRVFRASEILALLDDPPDSAGPGAMPPEGEGAAGAPSA